MPRTEDSRGVAAGGEIRLSTFNKLKYLPLAEETPFRISHLCCDVMKKHPASRYKSRTHNKFYLGTLALESRLRTQSWLNRGCNAFNGSRAASNPLMFWTEQDILEYITLFHLEIPSVYGDIVYENDKGQQAITPCKKCKYRTTGVERTGCAFCVYGLHNEKGTTHFQRMAYTHPQIYDYCLRGGQWVDNPDYDPTLSNQPDEIGWIPWNPKQIWVPSKDGLGMRKVFDMVNEIYGKDFYRYE